jgi:hypothetical protein
LNPNWGTEEEEEEPVVALQDSQTARQAAVSGLLVLNSILLSLSSATNKSEL